MIINDLFNNKKTAVAEFAPGGGGDDDHQDPYGAPKPEHYDRSIDFFGQFEADHFDEEDMNDATGEFKGYWYYDGKPRQIAYFKFDNPRRTGSNHPGVGWYYEPQNEGLNELDKNTVKNWIRRQPERIKGDSGLSRTNFKKAKRLVDKSIPSAMAKYKDPNYGQQEPRLNEVSLGDYRKKAAVSQAGAKMDRFFGRDDAAKVAAADQTIAKRERGLARADARTKPYTPPPHDAEKYQRELTAKYPNIDDLVAKAERNRDPYYDRAEGPAYYAGREAEQNYQRLRQIQRVIQGLNESLNRSHLP